MAIENKNMVVVHFRDVQINKVYNNFEIGRLVFSKFYMRTISDNFLLYTDIFFNFFYFLYNTYHVSFRISSHRNEQDS